MKVWIIYASGRKTMLGGPNKGDVHLFVYMVRGKKRQHPCAALKGRGKRIAFNSNDTDMSLVEFKQQCRRKSRARR